MTVAVRLLVDHALSTWDLNRVEIRAAVENHRSRAIPNRSRLSPRRNIAPGGVDPWPLSRQCHLRDAESSVARWRVTVEATGDTTLLADLGSGNPDRPLNGYSQRRPRGQASFNIAHVIHPLSGDRHHFDRRTLLSPCATGLQRRLLRLRRSASRSPSCHRQSAPETESPDRHKTLTVSLGQHRVRRRRSGTRRPGRSLPPRPPLCVQEAHPHPSPESCEGTESTAGSRTRC